MKHYVCMYMNEITLAESSITSTINAPIERINLPAWVFGLADDEYQRCSPAHVAAGESHSPDDRRMSINIEVLGGSVLISHYIEEIPVNIMYVSLLFLTFSHLQSVHHCR